MVQESHPFAFWREHHTDLSPLGLPEFPFPQTVHTDYFPLSSASALLLLDDNSSEFLPKTSEGNFNQDYLETKGKLKYFDTQQTYRNATMLYVNKVSPL